MTMNEYKNLKPGDIVVHVRKTYQNYDHTQIPCEPKIYKFKANNSSGIYLEYLYKPPFMVDGVKYASSMGWDNRLFCESWETLEKYTSGNYNKDIILDKQRWNSLEEFLLFKMENDYETHEERESVTRMAVEAIKYEKEEDMLKNMVFANLFCRYNKGK